MLDAAYWENRYKDRETGWDLGAPSTPIREYIDTLRDPELKILIPGCGNAYEAAYLFQKGFKNVHLLDFAKKPLDDFKARVPAFPEKQLIHADFFEHEGKYDLILEQTFFCALTPSLRQKYADHMFELLQPGAQLVGVLFNCEFEKEGPPFGGNKAEYMTYFTEKYEIQKMETCLNSIPPRAGKELFITLKRT